MENRNGLCVGFRLDRADGKSERRGAKSLIRRVLREGSQPKTLAGHKNYHTTDFVGFCREKGIRPHVALHEKWKIPGLDGGTTRRKGYEISQKKKKKLIEQKFGWVKTVGGLSKSRFFGKAKTEFWVLIALSVYNLVRIRNLSLMPA